MRCGGRKKARDGIKMRGERDYERENSPAFIKVLKHI